MTGVFCPLANSSQKQLHDFFLLFFSFKLSIKIWSATRSMCHRKSEMLFNHKMPLSTWWKTVISSFCRFVCQCWILAPWVDLCLLREVFGLSWCWYIHSFWNAFSKPVWLPGPVRGSSFLHLPQLLSVFSAFSGNYLEPEFIYFVLKALWQQI